MVFRLIKIEIICLLATTTRPDDTQRRFNVNTTSFQRPVPGGRPETEQNPIAP